MNMKDMNQLQMIFSMFGVMQPQASLPAYGQYLSMTQVKSSSGSRQEISIQKNHNNKAAFKELIASVKNNSVRSNHWQNNLKFNQKVSISRYNHYPRPNPVIVNPNIKVSVNGNVQRYPAPLPYYSQLN